MSDKLISCAIHTGVCCQQRDQGKSVICSLWDEYFQECLITMALQKLAGTATTVRCPISAPPPEVK